MFFHLRHLNKILLGLGTSLLCFSNNAIAAESIWVRFF